MKTMRHVVIGAVVLLFTSAIHSFAIEGLKISVQSSNVVLLWPSTNGETYIVQYRPTLNTTSSWTTLADFYPAATGTNITSFVHSNSVQYPHIVDGGTNDGSDDISPPELQMMSGLGTVSDLTTTETTSAAPMVMPANGSGDATPLAIYPPGFDLSGFIIFDPTTEEWMSGRGYTVEQTPSAAIQTDDMQPLEDSGTDPTADPGFYRVVRDGVHLWGLTNGMVLSNEVITPIEIAWTNNTDQIVGVSFYDANTNSIVGAAAQSLGSNVWFMEWNTTMAFNGTYNLFAELDFASNNPVISAPVAVTVNNLISFPNELAQTFGNQMWIYAQTIPNAAYELDMYDEDTNYLGSFFDYADGGGYISFLWDLRDYYGNPTSSSTYYGVYTVDTSSLSSASPANSSSPDFQALSLPHKTLYNNAGTNNRSPNDSSPTANAQYFWSHEPAWVYNGPWVIAYGQFANSGSPLVSADINMLTGDTLPQHGIMQVLNPGDTGLNVSPGNNSSTVFTINSAATANQLLGYLEGALFGNTYRNFFYFGHGNNREIGDYTGNVYPSGGDLTQDQIAFGLLNVPLSYQYAGVAFGNPYYIPAYPIMVPIQLPTTIQTAALHPYRFVYLDGCSTGAGNLSEAFGIPAVTLNTNNFAAADKESRVFIGYKSWKVDNITQFNWENYSAMMYNFMYAWTTGLSAQQCVNDAQVDNWPNPLPPHASSHMDSSAVVYGAADMNAFSHTP